jgi:hypothetical protein
MPPKCRRWPRHHLRVCGFKRSGVTDDARGSHVVQQAAVEGEKVVMRDKNKSTLIKASLHSMIKLLAKDTGGVQQVGATVRLLWGAEVNVRGAVSNRKSECQVFDGLCILLLRKAIEADGAQVGSRERDFRRIDNLYLGP